MISLRKKLFFVAAPFVLASATLAGVSTTVDGGQDAYLIRLSMWVLLFGLLVDLVTCALHRVAELRQELADMRDELAAAKKHAEHIEDRVTALVKRLVPLEDELRCRDLAKMLLNGSGDDAELLRTIWHPEDKN